MKKLLSIFIFALLLTPFMLPQSVNVWEKGPVDYSWFSTGHTTRGMTYNPATGHVLVAARSVNTIFVLDAATGDSLGMLDMTGVSGGTYSMNIVKATSDGAIYLCNLTVAGTGFKIYRWADESVAPTVAFSGDVSARTGDVMAASGTGAGTVIYASGSSNDSICVFTTNDGTTFEHTSSIAVPSNGAARGGIAPVTTGTSSDLWINGAGTQVQLIDSNGNMIDTVSSASAYSGWHNVGYLKTTSGEEYIAIVGRNDPYGTHTWLLDVTNSKTNPTLAADMNLSVAYTDNTNATADVSLKENADGSISVYTMITNNGVAEFKVYPKIPIAMAREDLNSDFIPDMLNDTVFVHGVVISPNYQTSNRSYYIWDGTAGIATFAYGLGGPDLQLGDSVSVLGFIDQYRGLTELTPLTDTSIVVLMNNAMLPHPTLLTVKGFLNNAETYEGTLVAFVGMSKVSGTWPSSGSATLRMTDGTDTVDIRIDSDTDIDGNTEPTWPMDIIGIGTQYTSSSSVYDDGYQILPRYYATDFLPEGTVPVELTSFAAKVNEGTVILTWSTSTETNNSGFEIQRSVNGKNYSKIGFVKGQGSSVEANNYSFMDKPEISSTFYYRLKQVDFNGLSSYSDVIKVSLQSPKSFTLGQNYPNPFNPTTSISFTLPVDSKVSLKVFNVLGQEVASLLNSTISAGQHQITFNASNLNSGVYFYQIKASGIDGHTYSAVGKMMLTK